MPIVTSVYAALTALLFLWLSYRVIAVRQSERVSLGDGGVKLLERRIRAQGNCAEYAPIALILLLLGEMLAAPAIVLHVLGLMLVIGRALHGVALSSNTSRPALRIAGMVLTLAMLALSALMVLGLAVFQPGSGAP